MYRIAEQVVLSFPDVIVHAKNRQQRGLAGARRTHDGDKIAFLKLQVNPTQNIDRPSPGI